ncbi:32172_t:CDS:1, partial [Racocetra persica]
KLLELEFAFHYRIVISCGLNITYCHSDAFSKNDRQYSEKVLDSLLYIYVPAAFFNPIHEVDLNQKLTIRSY